jgi:lipopolysaccharide export system permease protein
MTEPKPIHRQPGKTLYRYLVMEMVFPTLYTLGGLTIIILTKDLLSFSDLVINRGLSLGDVTAIAGYQTVPVVGQMLPFAVLVGGLVALGRLGADRELLMLEASGISSPRLLWPVLAFAALMSVLAFLVSLEAAPRANRALDEKLAYLDQLNPGAAITPGNVHRFGDWMLQAREVSSRGDEMRGVFLWMPRISETVFAQTGALEALPDGSTRVLLTNGKLILNPRKTAREVRFDEMVADLPRSSKPMARSQNEQLGSASIAELRVHAADESRTPEWRKKAVIALHQRSSLPAATLIFGLLIVPLFLSRAHYSRSGGGVMGIAATVVYYGLMQLAESLVFDGRVPAVLGMWMPNTLLLVIALAMALRMTRMSSFGRHSDRPPSSEPKEQKDASGATKLRIHPWPLQRYVAARFLQMAALCFTVVLVGYLLIDVLDRMSWLGKYGATVEQVMRYYGARIPLLASRVIPMSLLVATALTVSLLAAQGELMGMRSSGIPAPRALLPILIICALIVPAYFVLNNEVLPSSNALASYLKRVVKKKAGADEGLGAWFRNGDRFFQADQLDPKAGTARNITVFQLDETGLPTRRSDAIGARHIGNGVWLLQDSVRVESRGDELEVSAGPTSAQIGEAIQADVDTRHLSVGDLQREIAEVEASGLDATHYRVDLLVKLASPVACFVLPALALFFAVGGPPHPSSATTLVLIRRRVVALARRVVADRVLLADRDLSRAAPARLRPDAPGHGRRAKSLRRRTLRVRRSAAALLLEPAQRGVDRADLLEQCVERVEVELARAVTRRLLRVRMRLDEQRVDAGRDGCARQRGDEAAVAAGCPVVRARVLHRVRRVEADRRELADLRQAAHVRDQVVVAERGAAVGDERVVGAERLELLHGEPDVRGRDELRLLQVDGLAGRRARGDQVGLPAQECGNLQAVDDLGRDLGVARLVDVGHDRETGLGLHGCEDPQTFVEPGAAVGVGLRAVGLVERRLEDQRHAVLPGDRPDRLRAVDRVLSLLEHVEPRDQRERRSVPDADLSDLHCRPPRVLDAVCLRCVLISNRPTVCHPVENLASGPLSPGRIDVRANRLSPAGRLPRIQPRSVPSRLAVVSLWKAVGPAGRAPGSRSRYDLPRADPRAPTPQWWQERSEIDRACIFTLPGGARADQAPRAAGPGLRNRSSLPGSRALARPFR